MADSHPAAEAGEAAGADRDLRRFTEALDRWLAALNCRAEGGSVVLMHLGGWNTLEALPGILAAVEARGLEPVTLDRMLAA